MRVLVFVLIVGLLGGVAAGLQAPLAGILGQRVGIMGSVFVIHLGGTLCSALLLGVPGASDLGQWRGAPWFALWAGALGLLLVGSLSFCIPRIGAAATITLVMFAQLTVASLLDHFGLLVDQVRPVSPSRILGVGILLLGTWLVVRP